MILDRLFEQRWGSGSGGTLQEPNQAIMAALGIAPTVAGVSVTENTADTIPAVYGCVRVISETVGQASLKVMRKLAKGKEPDPSHPLYAILHDLANPEMTASEFRENLTGQACLWGQSFAEVQRRKSGTVQALWPLRSDCMMVDRGPDNRLRYTYQKPGDRQPTVYRWDPIATPIFHLRINDGRSPIRVLRETLGLTKAMEQYGAALFGNDARPGGVLQGKDGTVKNPDKAQQQQLREQWEALHRGPQNAHRLAILPAGWQWQQVGMPPEDTQFLEARKFQVEEIARIYRVPLFMIQHTEKSTSWGTGIEQMSIGFVRFTMMPWLIRWQQVIARDLLTYKSFETHEAVFNVASLERGDYKSTVEAITMEVNNQLMTPNEGRALLDRNATDDEGGDKFYRPANIVPADAPAQTDPADPPATDPAVTPAGDDDE